MEPLGRFPRVLNRLPREHIEGPPRGFLKAKPRPHPRPDPRSIYSQRSSLSTQGIARGLHSPRCPKGFSTDCYSFWIPNKSSKKTNIIKTTANVVLGSPFVLTLGSSLESLSQMVPLGCIVVNIPGNKRYH